jgi:hypothetical protein
MHILHLRVIGALWIIAEVWLGWGVMRQAWSDASEGRHRADELLLTAFFVTYSALAVCAAFGVLRDRRWAIWTLRVVGSLVLLDTLCYFSSCAISHGMLWLRWCLQLSL